MTAPAAPDAARAKAIADLSAQWAESGLQPGDTVLIHSDISRTIYLFRRQGVALEPADILESFLRAIGAEGTLLLPLFNFGFAKGKPFDLATTPSEMGAITEAGRKRPDAVRTGHPIYSFAVLGRQRERFAGIENFSGYGPDSPFALLREMGGKVGVLDLNDQQSMTYIHHIEEMEAVPYRYHKKFRGAYTDASGRTTEREFGLFVRDLEKGVTTTLAGLERHLWERGCYTGFRPGVGSGFRTIGAQLLHATVAQVIRSGQAEGMLVTYQR